MKRPVDFDRPHFHQISEVPFPDCHQECLSNGIPVHLVTAGDQEIVKIDFVIEAGRPFEHKKLASRVCSGLLKEGTLQYSSKTIAEKIDHVGATLSFPFAFDEIVIQVHCLTRHLPTILPILSDIIMNPIFPEDEITWYCRRAIQRLKMDLAQNEIMAFRKATEIYFGSDHPYGYNSTPELYGDITQGDLQKHHSRTFSPERLKIFVAGKPHPNLMADLDHYLGKWNHQSPQIKPHLPAISDSPQYFEHDCEKSQSAIRVGRKLFDSNHQDFPGMLLLNTLLGGYFGSRLMKNIREDKGYTYGIHAGLETMRYDGYISISLETDRRHVPDSLTEIDREIELLQTQLIPEEELQMVKNYICGYILSRMDGPLRTLSLIRKNILMGCKYDQTSEILQAIVNTTSADLQDLACRYLNKEGLTTVIIH